MVDGVRVLMASFPLPVDILLQGEQLLANDYKNWPKSLPVRFPFNKCYFRGLADGLQTDILDSWHRGPSYFTQG